MPYETIEHMHTRGHEKITQFLTVQQLFGMGATLLPGIAVTMGMGGLLRTLVLLLCAVLGYLLATEVRGMAPYQRLFWRLRGVIIALFQDRHIAADDLPGTVGQLRLGVERSGAAVTHVAAHALRPLPIAEVRPMPIREEMSDAVA